MSIYRGITFAALSLALATSVPARACNFARIVTPQPPTLHKQVAASQLIVYGHLEDIRKTLDFGNADLVITSVLKDHPALRNRRRLRLPRYLYIRDHIEDPKNPPRLLVFVAVSQGKLDYYRGLVAGPGLLDYLKGLQAIDVKDRVKLLRYCFDYLDHPDVLVRRDAYREFIESADGEIRQVAKRLPGARLRRWLMDPRTPLERRNLYGFLLGNGGGDLDADLLRGLLDKLGRQDGSMQRYGLLTGYVLLRPREGWAYVRGLLDPTGEFQLRLMGFRAIQFLHSTRPGMVPQKDLLAGLQILLYQGDFADLPIEYLRGQRCWELTGQILPLYNRESHQAPFMRRAILRYAVQCPGPQAREFVAGVRRDNAELVAETEELLKLERSQAPRKP
jgi:hypothetical protein